MTIRLRMPNSGQSAGSQNLPAGYFDARQFKTLLEPMLDRQVLMEMAVKARRQAQPDATQHVVRLIQEL